MAAAGDIGADDRITIVERYPAAITIPELLRLYLNEEHDLERLRQVIAIPALSHAWRTDLRKWW